jgi:hypothetical protein
MEYNNDCISLMLVATSLCSRYDEWTQNMLDILDMNTNETCKKMKQQYPEATDKVIQSVVFSILLYIYKTITQTSNQTSADNMTMFDVIID